MKRELLQKFFEDKTTLQEEVEIKKWVESSDENYQVFLDERKLFDISNLLPIQMDSISKRKILTRKIMFEFGKIAAIMILTFAIAFSGMYFLSDKQEVAMQKITVPAGQRIKLELTDGTIVWLNSRSELQYPAIFSKKSRNVHLNGEAYFEVTNNKTPFVVETFKGNIEVLGTKFNVEAYSDNDSFVTSLMEGMVKVTKKDAEIILQPAQMATIQQNGELKVLPIVDYNIYRWKEGLICFKDETLYNILKKFEKCYGIEFVIQNELVKNQCFTGKFRQSDGILYALRVLQRDANFSFERDEASHLIYIR